MAVNIGPKIGIDGEAEYRKEINNIIQQAKTLASEMKAVTAEFDDNTSAQKKAKAQAEILAKQVKTQTERVDKLTDMLEKSKKEFGENDDRTLKWQQAVNEANAELSKMTSELKDAQTQSSKFRTGLDKAGNSMKTMATGSVKKLTSALGTGLKTAVKGTISVLGSLTAAAATAVVGLGKIGLEYNMEMETYTTNFQTMLGSAEAAAAKVESLKEMAAATPFEMTDLANATQQLLAMGVASEDTNQYMQQLGDISLGNVEKFNSLIGAFGKMNSSGKVTLEYINIMAEQGFNPLNLIAQETGETMTEVYDRVSKGKVTFDEVKAAISRATSEGGQFYKGMEQASKTTEGMISTLKDNATALVGEVFEPISESLAQTLLPGAIDAIEQLSASFETDGIAGMVDAAGNILGETLGAFTSALPEFADLAVGIVENLIEGLDRNLDAITDGAVKTVLTLADGIIEMAPELIVTGAKLILKLAAGLLQGLPDLIGSIPDLIVEIVEGFAAEAEDFEQIGKDIVNGIWNGIVAVWEELLPWLQEAWEGLSSWFLEEALPGISDFGNWFDSVMGGSSGISINGSHAGGLGYVPWDGYIAQLHQGEMVLTRSEAETLRQGGTAFVGRPSVNYGGFTFQVYAAEGQDVEQIADAVYERFQTEIERREAALS